MLLLLSICSTLLPTVKAVELTNQQKSLDILTNVLNLNTSQYNLIEKEYPQSKYRDFLPEQKIRFLPAQGQFHQVHE